MAHPVEKNDAQQFAAAMQTQFGEIEAARGGRPPMTVKPLGNLDLNDLNIRIRNLAASQINVTRYQVRGNWFLDVSCETNTQMMNIQKFVNGREMAVFHVINRGKPSEEDLREVADHMAQQSQWPLGDILEMLKNAPLPIQIIAPGENFPEVE